MYQKESPIPLHVNSDKEMEHQSTIDLTECKILIGDRYAPNRIRCIKLTYPPYDNSLKCEDGGNSVLIQNIKIFSLVRYNQYVTIRIFNIIRKISVDESSVSL